MNKKDKQIFSILNFYKKKLEELNYKVIYIGLYGSQNYNIDDEYSDIDVKAIVLPTLSQIIHRKAVSAILETEYGAIDYKDLITFNEVIRKGNFSYIEAIQTKYRIGELEKIDEFFGNIKVNLKSIMGGMLEKRKALTHEYPSKVEEFKKFGCDPKQFHHIVRLFDVLMYNLENAENKSYLTYNESKRDKMIHLKRELGFPLKETETISDELIQKAREEINNILPNYKYEQIDNSELIDNYIEEKLKEELCNK